MEKQKYVRPEIVMNMCDLEDVIRTSEGQTTGGGGGIVLPDDEW